MDFGYNLKKLREKYNLNREELAEKLEINIDTLNQYESNQKEPEFKMLSKIKNYFGVSYDDLLKTENKNLNKIAIKIETYMEKRNLEQKVMAKLLGMSPIHLSLVLNGHKNPGSKMIERYYNLPGIPEKEAIQKTKDVICKLWLEDKLDKESTRKLLKILQYK
jgi:transcriptional regulator with XRE-family HTH domain